MKFSIGIVILFILGSGIFLTTSLYGHEARRAHEVEESSQDFVGTVYTPIGPKKREEYRHLRSSHTRSVANAMVTIMSGERSGEQVITNRNGQYSFPAIAENSLHLSVQKEGFETKEVIVHRSHQTCLANGVTLNYRHDIQQKPGNILIGHCWPDAVRFLFEEMEVVPDLLLVKSDKGYAIGMPPGTYCNGVIVCTIDDYYSPGDVLHVYAHEIIHAHQASSIFSGSFNLGRLFKRWTLTPEGRAFVKARKKDWMGWKKIGKTEYYSPCDRFTSHLESAAEVGAFYFGIGRWETEKMGHADIKATDPHRYQWARKWLGKE